MDMAVDAAMEDAATDDASMDDASMDDASTDDAGPGECPDPAIVDSDIDEDAEWPPTNRRGCVDYRIVGTLRVDAALTIEPAAEIAFAEGAGLTVEDGSLSAVGTTAEPIVFAGDNAVPGHWEALRFASDRSANELRHVVVEHGGRGEDFGFSGEVPANVIVADGGRLALRDSTLRLGGEHGLFLEDGAILSAFTENVFDENGGAPIRLLSNQLGMLDGTSAFADNGESHIAVASSTTEDAQSWPATTVPLRFSGKHYVQLAALSDAVTIEEGGVIELGPEAGIRVNAGGLSAIGTETDPIVFRGALASPGLWEALIFASGSTRNRLEWTELSHGGLGGDFAFSGNTPAMLIVSDGAQLSLTDSTLSASADVGLHLDSGAALDEFARNAFGGNEGPPVRLRSAQLGELDGATDYDGDTLSLPNDDEYLHVDSSTTTEAATWRSIDLPYRFHGKHYIDLSSATDAVTIEAGTDIELGDGAGLKVSNGALSAIGDPADLIVFTGAVETTGYWEAIIFESNNPSNEISHAEISYGGKGDDFSFSGGTEALVIVTSGAQATVQSSFLSFSPGACFAGAGDLMGTGNTLTGCI